MGWSGGDGIDRNCPLDKVAQSATVIMGKVGWGKMRTLVGRSLHVVDTRSQWTLFVAYVLLAQGALFVKVWDALLREGTFSIAAVMTNHKWAMTHYAFHYGLEFVKRGVVGTIFHILSIPLTYSTVFLFSIFCSELVILLAGIYFHLYISDIRIRRVFFLVFALSPATIMHLGYDLARYDQCNFVLTLVILLLIYNRSVGFLKAALITFLLFVQILIHEAALLIIMPALFLILYDTFRGMRRARLMLSMQVAAVVAATALVFFFGSASERTLATVRAQLASAMPGFDTSGALAVWQRGVFENIRFTLAYGTTRSSLLNLALGVPLVFLHMHWFWMWFSTIDRLLHKSWFFLAPFAGLPILMVLGIDWFRWLSLSIFMLFLMSVYIICRRDPSVVSFKRSFCLVTGVVVCSALVGPFGVTTPFPLYMCC